MNHFARWVFFHARQSAELDHVQAAAQLCAIAIDANHGHFLDMRAFATAGRLLGWKRTADLVEKGRARLGRGKGRHTRKQSWME